MIAVISKTAVILAAGSAAALSAYMVYLYLAPRLGRTLTLPGRKAPGLNPAKLASLRADLLRSLSEDPGSSRSKKIRAAGALLLFLPALAVSGNIVFALIAAALVYLSAAWYFNGRKKKALALFDDQLVEALGAITNSVRAGQSLPQALENTVRDAKPPLADHFREVLKQLGLGTPMNEALLDMTRKVPSKDLRIAVMSINLARETGGSLGEILTRLSDTMRERKKIQGKIKALTAQGKGSGMVMSGVPFLLLAILYLMEPDLVGLMFSTLIGNIMLAVVICMIGTAIIVINKIIDIDI